ncbi:uncharacterized protein LOC126843719 [Adelges cooleyi]|uniref:uncharacterized protein LOC126843719 n=1 Tax=Adelges cooleyi TaxID=133065 RepID=UPI00217FF76E|nr:uncharacterized protein LOC126843719 [Adelges cooleyi]
MGTITYYFVLSVCVFAFATHDFKEKDIVHFRFTRDNKSTDYYMFVAQNGVNPESFSNSAVIGILKPTTADYIQMVDKLSTAQLPSQYKGRFTTLYVGDELVVAAMV